MSDGRLQLRLLVDEDLSPSVPRRLRDEDGIDAVAVRDRGKLSATDSEVLDLAFAEDRVLVTANVGDFRRMASARELHAGIVLLEQGELVRDEQLAVVREAVAAIEVELGAGRDMVNRALLVGPGGQMTFMSIPPEAPEVARAPLDTAEEQGASGQDGDSEDLGDDGSKA